LSSLRGQIIEQQTTFSELSKVTSRIPYYKYNSLWSRDVQNTIFLVLYASWLEGAVNGSTELLAPIDQVGQTLGVPVNLKDEDRFHISIEEYLQSLITLIDELVRSTSLWTRVARGLFSMNRHDWQSIVSRWETLNGLFRSASLSRRCTRAFRS